MMSSMSSSAGLFRSSSQLSHRSSRTVSQLALDTAGLLSANTVDKLITGKKYTKIRGELDDDEYESLSADKELALVRIRYCRRGLHADTVASAQSLSEDSGLPSSEVSAAHVNIIKRMKDWIKHDYLVLELQRGDASAKKVYLLAEKTGGTKAGIHVSYIDIKPGEAVVSGNTHDGVHVIECGNARVGPLQTLVDVLKEFDPHYSLRNSNCWDYATIMTKRLLTQCAQAVSEPEKGRLLTERDALEAHLNMKRISRILHKVAENAGNILSSPSV